MSPYTIIINWDNNQISVDKILHIQENTFSYEINGSGQSETVKNWITFSVHVIDLNTIN